MGERRERRLQRARQLRVGAAVVACVALLAGTITVVATTAGDDEAAAGTSSAAPARHQQPARAEKPEQPARKSKLPATIRAHTVTKTEITKLPPPAQEPVP